MEEGPASAAGRPSSSSGSASLPVAAAGSRPSSAGSSGSRGGIRSKLSLKRKRTNTAAIASKPSSSTDRASEAAAATASSSSSLRKQKGSTRRKKKVISGVFAARRQAREQQRAAAAAAAAASSSALTFPDDDLSVKFGGNDDETKQKSGSGTTASSGIPAHNRNHHNAGSGDDTDPCSSETDENEFEWSQSQRRGGVEDSQDSMASGGSLQSAVSDGTGASNGSDGCGGGSNIKKKKLSAKRRKRNASANDKPPIPSFSPVEWSSSHGDDNHMDGNVDKARGKDDKNSIAKKGTEKEEKATIKAKPKSKPKATKSIKQVGVGLDSPSSSDEDKHGDTATSSVKKISGASKKDENTAKKVSAEAKRTPDISTNDRAALAAAKGDMALAVVETALAKSESESAPAADDISSPEVSSRPKPEADTSATTTPIASAATSSAAGDDVKISGAPNAANTTSATAGAPESGSKGTTAIRGWNCSACTLLNTSLKRKCEACGTGRPSSKSPSEKLAGDVAAANIDSVDANPSDSGINKGSDGNWKCSKCTLDNDVRKLTCDACGKPKQLEAPAAAGAKSPVIDLSLDDGDETNDDGQQKHSVKKADSTNNKKRSAKEKPAAPAKKQQQNGGDSEVQKSKTGTIKKAKTSKTSKKAEGTATIDAGTTKAKAAQKKRKRQQPKKKVTVESSPTDDFHVSTSKMISDQEKALNRQQADFMRVAKNSGGDYENATKRTKRGGAVCALCSTCSCSRGSALKGLEEGAKLEATNPISKLARSDAEIERALIGRLDRLEKSASWFDTMCYKVGRELKKHRNKVAKKRASLGGTGSNEEEAKPRFLADADVDGQDKGVFYPRAKRSRVEKAHQGLFGTEPVSKEAQPTLTQMMRGEDEADASDDIDDTCRKQAPDKESKGMELDPVAEDELFAVQDNDSVRDAAADDDDDDDIHAIENGAAAPNESIIYEEAEEDSPVDVRSPMADYHEASQRGLERASRKSQIGMWNSASSATLSSGNTEELLESPEKKSTSYSSNAEEMEGDFNQKVDAALNVDSEAGIDDLLELFQEDPSASTPNTPSPETSLPSPGLQSQLTQRGQNAMEELQDAILADPERLQAIQAACPNWQDSIQYPFLHTNSGTLEEALANVRDARRKLQESRERILAAIKQREEVHNMFEAALLQSINRFASADNGITHSPGSCSEEKKSE